MQLRDRKVLLTGASGGIGKALAAALLQQGARLVLAGRNLESLQRIARQLLATQGQAKLALAQLDLGSDQMWQQAQAIAQQHPDVDVLVNCAGRNLFAGVAQTDPVQTAAMLDVNLKGTILLTQALLPTLLTRPQAMIVNVGSTFGSIGYPGFAVYCASKFGVRGFTEALQRELAQTRVKVVYVAPRATATDMNEAAVVAMNNELGNKMDAPALVAACVVRAIDRERPRLFIGWPEKLFVFMNGLFTSVVDKALRKQLPVIQRFLSNESKSQEVKS
ncbi:MAG TPA: SDR family oxidoreductase [Candidatus Kapabacteria bacterium]|nr:SDR family oxidoreductase [Candidatus Kapabacteria bacterium]